MQPIKRFIVLLTCLFTFALCVYAHPGRTDSAGGHTDHSTGEYHYHHGYFAHDHDDMDGDGDIDCPYDFDDQTGVNSGSSSSSDSDNSSNRDLATPDLDESYSFTPSTSRTTSTEHNDTAPASSTITSTYSASEPTRNKVSDMLIILVQIFLLIVILTLWRLNIKKDNIIDYWQERYNSELNKNKKASEEFEKSKERIKADYERNLQSYKELLEQNNKAASLQKSFLLDKFSTDLDMFLGNISGIMGDVFLMRLSGAPQNSYIDKDGFPGVKDSTDYQWGEEYTFFVSRKNGYNLAKYHRAGCRYCRNGRPINALEIEEASIYSPCRICCPILPSTDWIQIYNENREFIEKYSKLNPDGCNFNTQDDLPSNLL